MKGIKKLLSYVTKVEYAIMIVAFVAMVTAYFVAVVNRNDHNGIFYFCDIGQQIFTDFSARLMIFSIAPFRSFDIFIPRYSIKKIAAIPLTDTILLFSIPNFIYNGII